MLRFAAPLLLMLLVAGAARVRPEPTAAEVVAAMRRAHGVDRLDAHALAFTFRGTRYAVSPLGGPRTTTRTRTLPDSLGGAAVVETVHPDGAVTRQPVGAARADTLRGREADRVASGIGAVVYFAAYPHGLADASVRLRRLPDDTLRRPGHPPRRVRSVEVTFDSTGGRSWRDRYVVWVDAERHTLDAFAYDYEDGDGETRLRLTTRVRTVNGVRVQDYATFTDPALKGRIEHYLRRIGTPTLRPVSDIVLDDVRVGE